mgnify:CR=1 FL=1
MQKVLGKKFGSRKLQHDAKVKLEPAQIKTENSISIWLTEHQIRKNINLKAL